MPELAAEPAADSSDWDCAFSRDCAVSNCGLHGLRHDGRSAKFRQNVARFRLYRLRFLQENMRFAAFFKIYQILKLKFLKFDKILQILRHLQFFAEVSRKLLIFQTDFLRKF